MRTRNILITALLALLISQAKANDAAEEMRYNPCTTDMAMLAAATNDPVIAQTFRARCTNGVVRAAPKHYVRTKPSKRTRVRPESQHGTKDCHFEGDTLICLPSKKKTDGK